MAKLTGGTLGHYSQHIAAAKGAGVRHLGEERQSQPTHNILQRGAGMPSVPSPLPTANMNMPGTGPFNAPANPASFPKGTIIT